jgi:cytochrome c biogenesis protein CcmG/thiol:disulfide interchange protein DsbE
MMIKDRANKKSSTGGRWVIIGVIVAIVAALAIAVLVGGDSSDDASPAPTSFDGEVAQNQPVTVEGSILEPLSDPATDPAVGAVAPTLKGATFDGSPVNVIPGDGSPYMVVFLAHWCPHCNAEVPRLIEWQQSGAVPADLKVIGVSTGVAADRPNYPPSQWVVDKGWPWPVMADSTEMNAAAAYGVSGYPFFTIVGADGTVKVRVSGEVEVDALDRIVTEALAS